MLKSLFSPFFLQENAKLLNYLFWPALSGVGLTFFLLALFLIRVGSLPLEHKSWWPKAVKAYLCPGHRGSTSGGVRERTFLLHSPSGTAPSTWWLLAPPGHQRTLFSCLKTEESVNHIRESCLASPARGRTSCMTIPNCPRGRKCGRGPG